MEEAEAVVGTAAEATVVAASALEAKAAVAEAASDHAGGSVVSEARRLERAEGQLEGAASMVAGSAMGVASAEGNEEALTEEEVEPVVVVGVMEEAVEVAGVAVA